MSGTPISSSCDELSLYLKFSLIERTHASAGILFYFNSSLYHFNIWCPSPEMYKNIYFSLLHSMHASLSTMTPILITFMNRCMSMCTKGLSQFIVDITKWRLRAVSICLFRLVRITFNLMFTGNVRFFATGWLQVTGLNNELSQRVGPVTTNWNRVS